MSQDCIVLHALWSLTFIRTFEVANIILHMSKLRFRKVKQLALRDTISGRAEIMNL